MKGIYEPVIVEEKFNQPISAVWNALTVLDQMKMWFFGNIPAFKPEVGFETQFLIVNEDRKFTHLWKITEVKPQHLLT